MESSQILGGTEECCSSESGWTMYIASPMHDDDDHSDADDNEEEDSGGGNGSVDDDQADGEGGGDDTDDSMASDASSGPSNRENPNGKGYINKTEGTNNEKLPYVSNNTANNKQMEKKKKTEERRIKEEKVEYPVVMANSATSFVPSGTRGRKSNWMDKDTVVIFIVSLAILVGYFTTNLQCLQIVCVLVNVYDLELPFFMFSNGLRSFMGRGVAPA
ncbi:hypothetical protein GIB67_022900 [Kingdonia uniflora]|uniref:Uncharacterized protein n=1 Tax=Kingdonia uniflora TaxID=39325 RepID=A0A7J7PCH6_9MAGN|nr:hypothetical protein GIB67_022900 [Kingdonia uniflora]